MAATIECDTFGYPNVYPLGTLNVMKDAGLRIRIQRDLRERFLAVCQAQDKSAAQVLREFMREYVELYGKKNIDVAQKVKASNGTEEG